MSLPFLRLLSGFVLACTALAATAQERFPSRPVEFIVPWGPGGGSDQTARVLSMLLETELKESVPVMNIPGATGNIGMQRLVRSPADGYKMALLAWDSFATLATQSPDWKLEDVVPLAIVIQLPSGLYAADNKFSDWKAVEDAARKQALNVAISGPGSPDEITINYLVTKGLKLTQVPYSRPGERYSALLGGHVDLLYSPAGNVISFVEGKKMRPVLFFASERLAEFPDTPTSKELGLEITLPQRRAVVVKAGTDPQRLQVLSQALARAVATEKYKTYLKESSAWRDSFVPGAESIKIMHRDLDDMRKIVQSTKKQ
jgi:tripartite-type tricarboxylate transporter receptor subunit TctC